MSPAALLLVTCQEWTKNINPVTSVSVADYLDTTSQWPRLQTVLCADTFIDCDASYDAP